MSAGVDLIVQGPVSARLAHDSQYYTALQSSFRPEFKSPHVVFTNPLDDRLRERAPGVGLGFSCGIDSFSSLFDSLFEKKQPGYAVTHLFCANVGAHAGPDDRAEFRKKFVRMKRVADEVGLLAVAVDSNIGTAVRTPFYHTVGAKTIGAALLFQRLWSRYYIASTYRYRDYEYVGSSAVADHLLSTDMTSIIHDGAQYTRVQKSLRISEWPLVHSHLDVCQRHVQADSNCSRCEKCVRTMVTFEMLGLSNRYSRVFDFTDFGKRRKKYVELMEARGTSEPNYDWHAIVEYAKRVGYQL